MKQLQDFRSQLAALVNIDSNSADREGVGKIGKYLSRKYLEMGLLVEAFDDDTRIQAKSHDEEDFDLLFVGHMDTVFQKGTVQQRPYKEKEGFAYGPGVADMKAGLVLILHLVQALRRERPDLRICIANNGDEEIGSIYSMDWLQKLARHGKYAFVFEPGRGGNAFVKARKGCEDLAVKFYGKASHAGAAPQDGASAVREMARWIMELTAMQNLEIGTSVNAGIVRGGCAGNVVADFAEALFDIRVSLPEELERIEKKAEELQANSFVPGVRAEMEFIGRMMPMNPSAKTKELISKIDQLAEKKQMSVGWVSTGGVSDANHIAPLGIPTICGCGPCGGGLHSAEEYLEIESIEKRFDLLFSLMKEL
ncbi:M20 family metallopeptidase [Ihubacter sp. mB4P-1]|uniref:M20 family metallopeptidase n=1 Tax=Ihubacter sp. mB4P-1 TaxID=3242370 RepID=UPI00137994FA